MSKIAFFFTCVLITVITGITVSCGGGGSDDFSKAFDKTGASSTKSSSTTTPTSGSSPSSTSSPTTPPSASGGATNPAGSSSTPTATTPASAAKSTGPSTAGMQTGTNSSSDSAITSGSVQDALKTPEGLLTFEELREKYPKELKEVEKAFATYKNVNFEQIRKDKSDALWTMDQFWGKDEEGDLTAFNDNLKKYGLTTKDIPKVLYDGLGRVDPLTFVIDALPEELRPPRSGEIDESAISEYENFAYGSLAVEEVAYRIVVYNVIQVGYTYQIQSSYGQLFFDSSSGSGSSGQVPTSMGMSVQLEVRDATSSSVTFRLFQPDTGVEQFRTYFR